MAERGVLAMSPGQALDDVLTHLQVDLTKAYQLKTWVAKPQELSDFSHDAQFCDCVGSRYTVRDVWAKRYGD